MAEEKLTPLSRPGSLNFRLDLLIQLEQITTELEEEAEAYGLPESGAGRLLTLALQNLKMAESSLQAAMCMDSASDMTLWDEVSSGVVLQLVEIIQKFPLPTRG